MMKISVVIPCYNEEDIIEEFYKELVFNLDRVKNVNGRELLFIDDGSKDNTLNKLKKMKSIDNDIKIISFSRNFGKEAAIYAGLENAMGDIVIVMDSDLQHDPKLIPEMIKYIEDGYDTVTTLRKSRKSESFAKASLSNLFYRLMNKYSEVEVKSNSQDYRAMKKDVVKAILSLREFNRFSKGIFSWVGFKVKYIETNEIKRKMGKSKWGYSKLLKYAVEGVVSFSTAPLNFATFFGLVFSIVSIISAVLIILQLLIQGKDVPGYASTITSILFIGGVQLLSLGIIAEYIGKMYIEIKDRPKYIIREKID